MLASEQKFLRSDETKQIPFANDKNMGQQLFQYIQRKLECYAVEVYAQISVCFPMIKDYPLWFNIELCAKIDTACSTTLNSLLNSINNEFLSRQNLLLKSFWIDSSSTCQIVIQASGSKWAECIGVPIRKDIMTVPDVQEVYKSARLHWLEIGRLIGEVSIPSTSRSLRASPLEASPPVTSRSRRSSKTASSTANSIVVNPGFITISITVPVGLPASGAVLRIAHPSNHRVLQDIFIPAGALPGSQLLVQIPA